MLHFQRLTVYQRSVQFLALAAKIIDKVPRGHSSLTDQLRRSSQSTPLNIAEATGRVAPSDAAHRFAIARGEAMESAAALDALRTLDLLEVELYEEGISLLTEIVSMLTRMCRPGSDARSS
jgi:four helix bundle protein